MWMLVALAGHNYSSAIGQSTSVVLLYFVHTYEWWYWFLLTLCCQLNPLFYFVLVERLGNSYTSMDVWILVLCQNAVLCGVTCVMWTVIIGLIPVTCMHCFVIAGCLYLISVCFCVWYVFVAVVISFCLLLVLWIVHIWLIFFLCGFKILHLACHVMLWTIVLFC